MVDSARKGCEGRAMPFKRMSGPDLPMRVGLAIGFLIVGALATIGAIERLSDGALIAACIVIVCLTAYAVGSQFVRGDE
jgi:hypothetical protein